MGHWICILNRFNWLITICAKEEFIFAILIRQRGILCEQLWSSQCFFPVFIQISQCEYLDVAGFWWNRGTGGGLWANMTWHVVFKCCYYNWKWSVNSLSDGFWGLCLSVNCSFFGNTEWKLRVSVVQSVFCGTVVATQFGEYISFVFTVKLLFFLI